MSPAAIVEQAPGVLALTGVLDYQSGPALREPVSYTHLTLPTSDLV